MGTMTPIAQILTLLAATAATAGALGWRLGLRHADRRTTYAGPAHVDTPTNHTPPCLAVDRPSLTTPRFKDVIHYEDELGIRHARHLDNGRQETHV